MTWDTVAAMNERSADFAAANAARPAPARFAALHSVAYRLALGEAGEAEAGFALAPRDVAGGRALPIGAGCTLVDVDGRPGS